jgi:hypothetical protein
MKILFPCHELDGLKKVDDAYLEEYNSAKLIGFECFLFDHDKFVRGCLSTNLNTFEQEETIMLRSWMLKPSEYRDLFDIIKEGYNALLVNNPNQYINCHYFTGSYELIKSHTAKSISISLTELNEEMLQHVSDTFSGKSFLMKDFVKSAKERPELFIMPAGISGKDLLKKVEEFIEYRGSLFNEGIVFKEFEELYIDVDGNLNEWRLFFMNGDLVSNSPNSNQKEPLIKPSDFFVKDVVSIIASKLDSNFFTIDVAMKKNGTWMIVETGDGQVSGLSPFQNILEFYTSIQMRQLKSTH